jgi:hypothetical protein
MRVKSNFPKNSRVEFKIENYLENNINLIEKDLKLISRQYKVYHINQYIGTIDLFCQAKDKAQVIIELKSRELKSKDLGQVMAYFSICKKRAESLKLPLPRVYCIGLGISPQYRAGISLLNNGKDINLTTQIYTFDINTNINNKEFNVSLTNYNFDDEGTLSIKL